MIGHMKHHRLAGMAELHLKRNPQGLQPAVQPHLNIAPPLALPLTRGLGGVKRLGGISPKATNPVFKERLAVRLNIAAKALEGKDYLMGKTFTVADAYLYTVLRWSPRMNVDLSPWPVLQAYMERIAARPAVKAAMAEEGL